MSHPGERDGSWTLLTGTGTCSWRSPATLEPCERILGIVSPSGERRASDRYQDVAVFEGLPFAPDPLEDSTPMIELVNPIRR